MLDVEAVKYYYEQGLWGETWVKNAVARAVITAGQYQEITGKRYDLEGEDS